MRVFAAGVGWLPISEVGAAATGDAEAAAVVESGAAVASECAISERRLCSRPRSLDAVCWESEPARLGGGVCSSIPACVNKLCPSRSDRLCDRRCSGVTMCRRASIWWSRSCAGSSKLRLRRVCSLEKDVAVGCSCSGECECKEEGAGRGAEECGCGLVGLALER